MARVPAQGGGLGLGRRGGEGSRLMEMAPVLRRHSKTILQPVVFREGVGACRLRLSVRAVCVACG